MMWCLQEKIGFPVLDRMGDDTGAYRVVCKHLMLSIREMTSNECGGNERYVCSAFAH